MREREGPKIQGKKDEKNEEKYVLEIKRKVLYLQIF